MKVVFLRSNPVDPDPRVEKEVNTLIKAGHSVTIVAWDRKGNYKIKKSEVHLRNGKVTIYRFGILANYGSGFKDNAIPLTLFQLRLIFWLLKNRKRYDLIHSCDFDTAFVSLHVGKMLKKKVIYDIFDYYIHAFNVPNVIKKIVEKRDHKLINSADGVIICSEQRTRQIKGTSPKKLVVLHNSPADITIESERSKLNENMTKIAYVGILSEGRLLRELANVIIKNPNLQLHIGGFGKLHDYFVSLDRNYDNIFYYGKVNYSKALELENDCDVMTALYDPRIANHYYAAPNKFYEALMLGKPLIMVKNTGMSELVTKNGIGEVIDFDENSLENAINNIIRYRTKWPEISSKMQSLYNNEYSWTKMESRLLDLYKNI